MTPEFLKKSVGLVVISVIIRFGGKYVYRMDDSFHS